MGIRKYKPTTPGRRGSSVADFVEITRYHAGEVAGASRCPRRAAATTRAGSPPGTKAAVTSAPTASSTSVATTRTACRPRSRTSSTTPTAPRASRCCTTPTARSATSSRRSGLRQGDRGRDRPGRRHQAGQQPAAAQHPGRHDDPRDRAAPRRRRQDRPLGRRLGRSWWPRRAAARSCGCRPVRCGTSTSRCRATVGAVGNAEQSNINWGKAGRMRWKGKRPTVRGVGDEPGRPPARRWRGQDVRWSPPGVAVGQARGPHPQAQGQ